MIFNVVLIILILSGVVSLAEATLFQLFKLFQFIVKFPNLKLFFADGRKCVSQLGISIEKVGGVIDCWRED